MARVAPPSPSRDQHQGPRHGRRWSWFPAKTATRIVLVGVLISAAVAAAYLWSASQPQRPAVSVKPTGVRGDWKLTFDDEFSGTSLDTAKWSTGWYGSGITPPIDSAEKDCYDPAQVSEGGGTLGLTLIRKSEDCGVSDQAYTTGVVTTRGKLNFTYGFIEARVWLPAVPGNPSAAANWPDVWADGQSWPEDGEIDIAEGLGGDVCAHFHDPDNPIGVGAGG